MSRRPESYDPEAALPAASATTPLLTVDTTSSRPAYQSLDTASESSSPSSWSHSGSDDQDYLAWYNAIPPSTNSTAATTPAAVPEARDEAPKAQPTASAAVLRIVLVLILGTFTVNADGSLVLATHPTIASEFDALSASNWIFVAFSLAGAATQAMYGKLSDIYGRRALLIVSYGLFAAGCAGVGIASSMGQVILGRVVSGAGGSGLVVLAMLIISDLVPLRDAAAWQSYLNLAATTGRSLGGPLGGWLADTIGWRWSFLSQTPVFLLAIALTWFFLPSHTQSREQCDNVKEGSPLSRIDFPGAMLLALTMVAFLLPFEIGGSQVSWSHPAIWVLFAAAAILGSLFVYVEGWYAKEPIFPLELFRIPNVVLAYIITAAQCAAQLGLMFSVPLYFQVTQRVSNTVAGAYLFPAVAGNAIGAIASGIVIQRTARYKAVLVAATLTSAVSYLLLLLRWHGKTNVWEALYIIPGGLGTGAVQTGVFVAVQAATDPAHKAAALGGIWITLTMGAILGMTAVSAGTMQTMALSLAAALRGLGLDGSVIEKIVEKATSNINYIDQASPAVSSAVVDAYVRGLGVGHIVSLVFSVIAVTAAVFLREQKI